MHALPGKRYFVKKLISEKKVTKDIQQRNKKKRKCSKYISTYKNGNENRKTNAFSHLIL